MMARIYRPAKTAMQSGTRKTKRWILEWEPAEARETDPLMGWVSSGDTQSQLRLFFDTKEAAIAYAQENNIPHQVIEERPARRKIKSYAENFSYERREPWTH